MELTLEIKARLLHTRQAVTKFILAYLTSGLYGFIISTAFIYITENRLPIDDFGLVIRTIFFWPVFSFSSAKQIFGAANASVWTYLIAANFLIFITALFSFIAEKQATEFEKEIEDSTSDDK